MKRPHWPSKYKHPQALAARTRVYHIVSTFDTPVGAPHTHPMGILLFQMSRVSLGTKSESSVLT